jgi:hypothetical protein
LTASENVTVKRDATPPSVAAAREPAAPTGAQGWDRTNFGLSWTVEDAGSGIESSSGCAPAAIVADTTGVTFACTTTDAAGLTTARSLTVKRDTKAPRIEHAVAPSAPDGANGWYVTAPTVTFACSDETSGVASCSTPSTVGEAAAEQIVAGLAVDHAGNEARDSLAGLRVDLSDPVVACAGAPSFLLGESAARVKATVSDAISGPATAELANAVSTTVIGGFATTFTGRDAAGLTSAAACAYRVIYDWTGFFAPVENGGFNARQAGSSVPLKFSLRGDHGLNVLAPASPRSRALGCATATSTGDATPADPPGKTSLRYDAESDTYVFLWKTDEAWAGTCRELLLELADGTVHSALFRFG